MVRSFLISCVLIFFFTNCYHKTISGRKRYNVDLFKMKLINNDSLYKVVDTTKLYKLQNVFNVADNEYLDNFKYVYLKFYSKNKVAMFYYFDINNIKSLNPENADMGYYNYSKGKITTQIYFESPQSEGYIKEEYIIIKNDENIIKFKGNNYINEYKILDLPKEFLICKPDW